MLKRLCKQPAFHILVFCFFLTLFNWPILSIPDRRGDHSLFSYLFVFWALLIVLLIFIGISLREDSEQAGD